MDTKKCSDCEEVKPVSEYYKQKSSHDGLFATCKDCKKRYQREQYHKNKQDPEWIKKERERNRAKYHRLNYKKKHKPTPEGKKKIIDRYKKKYPEKVRALSRSSHIRGKNGDHWHHWCYKPGFEKDLILMTEGNHSKAHRLMVYDQDEMLYRDAKGNLLDTKKKHIDYLLKNSVRIIAHKKF